MFEVCEIKEMDEKILYVVEDQENYTYVAMVVAKDGFKDFCLGHTKQEAIYNLKKKLLEELIVTKKAILVIENQLSLLQN